MKLKVMLKKLRAHFDTVSRLKREIAVLRSEIAIGAAYASHVEALLANKKAQWADCVKANELLTTRVSTLEVELVGKQWCEECGARMICSDLPEHTAAEHADDHVK